MSETRLQLISHLQSVIAKRQSEGRTNSAASLTGSLSQYKTFRQWLANNFLSGSDLKKSLLSFISTEVEYFRYDSESGSIVNNKLLDPNNEIVMKPKILDDLEQSKEMMTFDDNLCVFELILFIINEALTEPMNISVLVHRIGQKCAKEFKIYKDFILLEDQQKSSKDRFELDLNLSEEQLLIRLAIELKPFFSYDLLNKTLTIAVPKHEMFECLNKTALVLLKKSLYLNLYRFGRRNSNKLQEWFETEHKILYNHMVNKKQLSLNQIIALYPKVFFVRHKNFGVPNGKVIDLQRKCLGEKRWQHFQLMYRYGIEIRGIEGIVTKVFEDNAVIKSETDFSLGNDKLWPEFKVNRKMVEIYGFQEVFDLKSLIHFNDRLHFNVKYIPNIAESVRSTSKLTDELWSVSSIYKIKHSAYCFIQSVHSQWEESSDAWNNMSDSDVSDPDSDQQFYN